MVYLVRKALIEKDWEKAVDFAVKYPVYCKENYKEVKSAKFFVRISGNQAEHTWVLAFDSLADEEKATYAMVKDPAYRKMFAKAGNYYCTIEDELYRELTPSMMEEL